MPPAACRAFVMANMGKVHLAAGGIPKERRKRKMEMLTAKELAEILHISYDTALNMIKYSGLPYVKIGRQYRVSKAVIDDLINQDETVIIDYDEVS